MTRILVRNEVKKPDQLCVVQASNGMFTELPLGYRVVAIHYGEDGPGVILERTRAFELRDQEFYSGHLQDWALDEHYGDLGYWYVKGMCGDDEPAAAAYRSNEGPVYCNPEMF